MKLYLSWIPIEIADGFDFKSLIFFTGLEDLLGFLDVKKQETRLNCASKHGVSTNLFVTSKIKFSNSPIHEFKELQKKQGLKCFLK